jgi:peptidoglycan/xylan/chitin deacetylase (PgdA/CDA1 family)
MDAGDRALYLTFDDGPVPGPTEFVLDALARASAKGTFFCIGDNIRKHPQIFRRIFAEGHTVGNHTMNHVNGWKTHDREYLSNVREFDVVARQQGYQPDRHLFRPPYGRITRRQIRLLGDYRIVMWDALSQDYSGTLSPEKCLRRTLRACSPGSIVVFHDSYKAQRNMEYALPRLLDQLGAKGYKFLAL